MIMVIVFIALLQEWTPQTTPCSPTESTSCAGCGRTWRRVQLWGEWIAPLCQKQTLSHCTRKCSTLSLYVGDRTLLPTTFNIVCIEVLNYNLSPTGNHSNQLSSVECINFNPSCNICLLCWKNMRYIVLIPIPLYVDQSLQICVILLV